MLFLISTFSFLFSALVAQAALPPQFSECLRDENSASTISVSDIKEIAKVTKVTYCQNQVNVLGKAEVRDLLSSPNVQMAISVSKSTYAVSDFVDLARSGSYVLYVDGGRFGRANLATIAEAGVQLVIMSDSAGLSKADMLSLAAVKPLVLNVNSPVSRQDLRDFVTAGMQVVIRTSLSGLNRADMVDVASLNPSLITVMP